MRYMGVLLRRLSIYSNGPYLSYARGLGLGLGWVRAFGYLLGWIFRFSCWMRVGIVIPPVLFLWIMEILWYTRTRKEGM